MITLLAFSLFGGTLTALLLAAAVAWLVAKVMELGARALMWRKHV